MTNNYKETKKHFKNYTLTIHDPSKKEIAKS